LYLGFVITFLCLFVPSFNVFSFMVVKYEFVLCVLVYHVALSLSHFLVYFCILVFTFFNGFFLFFNEFVLFLSIAYFLLLLCFYWHLTVKLELSSFLSVSSLPICFNFNLFIYSHVLAFCFKIVPPMNEWIQHIPVKNRTRIKIIIENKHCWVHSVKWTLKTETMI